MRTKPVPPVPVRRENSPKLDKITARMLEHGCPISTRELADIMCMSIRAMRDWVNVLLEKKAIHIGGWEGTAGDHAPLYWLGDAPGVRKPDPITDAERRRRNRENPEVREREASRKRADRKVAKLEGQSMLSTLLFGVPHGNKRVP